MLNEENAIRQRAYEIWQAEGEPQGDELSHWLRAQAEISRAKPAGSRGRRNAAPRRRTGAKAMAA